MSRRAWEISDIGFYHIMFLDVNHIMFLDVNHINIFEEDADFRYMLEILEKVKGET